MTVYLVGAGPGDPGLLTVRGAEVLASADVVVHDRLAEASLLDLAPPAARRIDVGKAPGGPVEQEEINSVLVSEGAAGRNVVRLKGGDPFVFGRGGEEAQALRAAGVDFEVVPGVTSAFAAPAYAGVPVTHRGMATSVTVVTGHSRHALDQDTNWEALAKAGGTIVVLMGVAHRALIADRLISGGLAPDTPVMAVHWGTRPEQRRTRVRLDELGCTRLEPPAAIVVGRVASLDLSWYDVRPLFAKRVVVTRSRSQASTLTRRLRDLGAQSIEVPAIRIEPPSDGGAALDRAVAGLRRREYAWTVFTSANAVEALLSRVPDVRALAGCAIAAVGPATAEALVHHRLVADVVPARSLAEGLVESLPAPAGPGVRVLLPRAVEGSDELLQGLARAGWDVDLVEAYRTVREHLEPEALSAVRGADAICFTSSSTVDGIIEAVGAYALPPVVVCIGPPTASTAERHGLRVDAVAEPHTLDGLVAALVSVFRGSSGPSQPGAAPRRR